MKKMIYVIILILIVGVVTMRVIENNTAPKLGVQNGQLKPLGSRPNSVSSQTDQESKLVAPISFEVDAKEKMAKIKSVIESMPGAKVKQSSDEYLYAVFTSALMRFKDDVEVYIDPEAKQVHFRSASRVGYSDLGVNRKRYEEFAKRLANQ
jgi:uncharacterized protein (DUF1499 family)